MHAASNLVVGCRTLSVSNLDKVFYPETGFTKGDIINYYTDISPVLLPHLRRRPITLKRYPDGVTGPFFYEKHCPSHRPGWIKTTRAASSSGEVNYCVIDDLPALIWAANLADLELHTFLHRAPALHRPTMVAFDLDPGPPADILSCCQVAIILADGFSALGLESFVKTSGSKGMQLYIPLNTPADYSLTKAFARHTADAMCAKFPELVVSKMQKSLRAGKVFIDWSQNDSHKTTVSVYSLRASSTPSVSTPVTWAEVKTALKGKDAAALKFSPAAVLKRVARSGDLFAPVLKLKQKLPRVAEGG
jgi:bifunctional non-homologous end joining protein LigD